MRARCSRASISAWHDGEIVALLGQSGSGKSTLLRIMAGLVRADAGEVSYRGQPLYGPARGVSMVFQSFALFPWLSVQQNVEIGLEARGIAPAERAHRAGQAIELIGLAGFEGALPRELSGGMRQRVGIARALVVEPEVLLMDEAFSALDVLTGERLREDILELWASGSIPTKAILMVSHNIEEAVLMADRVLVFASDPGRVRNQLAVLLPRPRDANGTEVRGLVDEVYVLMTTGTARPGRTPTETVRLSLAARLPEADVARMEGLLELLLDDPFAAGPICPSSPRRASSPTTSCCRWSRRSRCSSSPGSPTATSMPPRPAASTSTGRTRRGKRCSVAQLLAQVPFIAHIRHSLEQEPSARVARGAVPAATRGEPVGQRGRRRDEDGHRVGPPRRSLRVRLPHRADPPARAQGR